jgi:hypothetical protein
MQKQLYDMEVVSFRGLRVRACEWDIEESRRAEDSWC